MVLNDLPGTRRASGVPLLGLCCPVLLARSRASSHIVLRLDRVSAGHGFVAKLVTPAEFEGGREAAEFHVLPADRRDRIESSGPPRLARADTRGRVKAWLEAKNSSFRGSRSALKAVWVAATSTSGPGRTVDGAVFAIRTRRRSNRSVVVGPWDWVRGRCTRCSIRLVETGPAR